ncbi:aspartyl/asparaginyl beta-hydroxylase domain-containing protein [Bradyrhizobium sp. WSM 1704]|uniref:aspartyl/asparaginyl beta-hydroxylase domain-containing protein n=1 Tax=Bradyrhizobium semiaridum TaxID=2821404 RepID=UPI001CE2A732|nr:aspartyl/asparaginyl beta-hydroxylase domain-containing protein [Bradyrhizobium semiaridum]MCA6126141.1 aspartyl/asparaginyl beta-hydroxylase domain-containing protein [Bradyrhizobium semiaridum]
MSAQLLGKIDLDKDRLAADIRALDTVEFSQVYADFACGRWDICVLRNATGSSTEQKIRTHDAKALPTPPSKHVPYINELIERCFRSDGIRYVRIMRMGPNSCLIPHQDYLELNDEYVRIHVPIETNDRCWNTEDDKIYQMRMGEIWFLDATRIHSAGCFGETDRLHLMLDFQPGTRLSEVVTDQVQPAELRPSDPRPEMPRKIAEAIDGLGMVLSKENFRDVVAILSKFHFHYRSHGKDVYRWLSSLCEKSGQADMIQYAKEIEKYYTLSRQPDTVPRI